MRGIRPSTLILCFHKQMRDSSEYINIMFSQKKSEIRPIKLILCFHKQMRDSSEYINIMFSQTNERFVRVH